ncbi:MAG TPA: response regulator transcription factor [Candidatus Limnocylindrales bacterium]|nr:response regulator transcription factor [Candidatus Limnocylindrales bacterium]
MNLDAPEVRVVIADDEAIVRHGLRLILDHARGISVVAEAANGREAIEAAATHRPDVVLMDVRMPVLDGIEATRRITTGAAQVLILTTYDLDENLYLALRAGACGFLLKTSAPEDLVHAVRVVARGDALVEPKITRRLLAEFLERPPPLGAAVPTLSHRYPNASARCYASSPPAGRTPRSAPSFSSAKARRRPTWRASSQSSACATASRL